jgi:hypothetical protein
MEPLTIAEWRRNAREVVRISLSEYQGAPTIDVRVWYDDGAGKTKPGRKGLTLSTKYLPRLADALAKALAEAHARGLVPADASRPTHD